MDRQSCIQRQICQSWSSNKTAVPKLQFRQTINHCKWVLESTKLVQVDKTKEFISFVLAAFNKFQKVFFSISAIHSLFNDAKVFHKLQTVTKHGILTQYDHPIQKLYAKIMRLVLTICSKNLPNKRFHDFLTSNQKFIRCGEQKKFTASWSKDTRSHKYLENFAITYKTYCCIQTF